MRNNRKINEENANKYRELWDIANKIVNMVGGSISLNFLEQESEEDIFKDEGFFFVIKKIDTDKIPKDLILKMLKLSDTFYIYIHGDNICVEVGVDNVYE